MAFVLDKKDLFTASFLILEFFLLALPKLRRKNDPFEANILTGTKDFVQYNKIKEKKYFENYKFKVRILYPGYVILRFFNRERKKR